MAFDRARLASCTALSLLISAGVLPGIALAQQTTEETVSEDDVVVLDTIVLSAEEQIKQSLGVSNISAEDIAKAPVSNDLSEIIRKQPGVNLTGNTASGTRGNQRQIDIRGMGPENTLILIDGKPVLSRNAVKMGRSGERDSRGDTNWVPAEMVERIEVLRGPAAARYGSGASGGVVNIITKRPETMTGTINLHYTQPEDSLEGGNKRVNGMFAMPLTDNLTLRLTGNYSKTDADDPTVNDEATGSTSARAGREGVTNKDLTSLLTWKPVDGHQIDFELGVSKQDNIYTGDTNAAIASDGSIPDTLAQEGATTNIMRRTTASVTHRGEYSFGESFSYLQFEQTRNARNPESTTGRVDGQINNADTMVTIPLINVTGKTEWTMPRNWGGFAQMLTLGAEFRYEHMDDAVNTDDDGEATKMKQLGIGIYAEDNIQVLDDLTLTPGLRADWADTFGVNISPSLNANYQISPEWTMKAGVARAFKAPNLFQLNPNYRYGSTGNGCRHDIDDGLTSNTCYIYGNPDLEPETSLNTEIGVAYQGLNDINASITYFHNDYKNRISAGDTLVGYEDGRRVFIWDNTPRAVIEGLEGNFSTPLGEAFAFNANATYMITSEDRSPGANYGQPLSLVPKYTVNVALDWYAREDLTITASATAYGKIEARTIAANTGDAADSTEPREAYAIANLGVKWDINDKARVSTGVTNIFNRQLYRTGEGANTYNEAGRAFYLTLSKTF